MYQHICSVKGKGMRFRRLVFLIFFLTCIYIFIIIGYVSHYEFSKTVRLSTISAFDSVILQTRKGNRTFICVKDLFISEHRKSRQMLYGNENTDTGSSLTLVTQTHIDNLYLLEYLAHRWNGPISIAVFIERDKPDLIQQVRYFYDCLPHIKANTSFHILCPVNSVLTLNRIDCSRQWLKHSLNEETRTVVGMPYPHNHMRNLALPDEEGGFIFYVDIDMVPSWNVHDHFLDLTRHVSQTMLKSSIFIVPSFESKDFHEVPGDRMSLQEGLKEGRVQTFHNRSCPKCQNDTRYNLWFDSSNNDLVYPVIRKFCAYEPFYIISKDRHLQYDERFVGRGYDRISQVTEVWLSGLDFYVLRNSFIVHRGFHNEPPPLPLQSPPHAQTTLHPKIYRERHIEFLRAKYLLDAKYRDKMLAKFGKQRVEQIENKLSINEFKSRDSILREIKRIEWLSHLGVDEDTEYQWYMKYGDKGYIEHITTEQSEIIEDPLDPNKHLFLNFLMEKMKIYKSNKRNFCML